MACGNRTQVAKCSPPGRWGGWMVSRCSSPGAGAMGQIRGIRPRSPSWAAGPAGGGRPGWGWGGFAPPGPAPSFQGEGGLTLLQEGLECASGRPDFWTERPSWAKRVGGVWGCPGPQVRPGVPGSVPGRGTGLPLSLWLRPGLPSTRGARPSQVLLGSGGRELPGPGLVLGSGLRRLWRGACGARLGMVPWNSRAGGVPSQPSPGRSGGAFSNLRPPGASLEPELQPTGGWRSVGGTHVQ